MIRKVQILKHLASCKKRQVSPTEPATVEPAAISELIVPCEPIVPSTSVDINEPVATSEPIVPSAPVDINEHVATSEPIVPSAPVDINEHVATSEPIVPIAPVDINEHVATSEPIVPSAPVAFKEPAVAVEVPLPVKSLLVPKKLRIQKKVQCVHCGVTVNKKNLDVHVKRKHTDKICDTEDRHLPSQCIDPVSGIYVVEKSFRRPCSVIHVQKKTSGPHPVVACEMVECISNVDLATRSGFQHFECIHLKSLQCCPWPNSITVVLDEDVLVDMIATNVFGEETKTTCVATKAAANAAGVPLSVELTIGGPSTKKYISVYEPKVSNYSRLGRVIASYDSTRNTWHCPCAKPRRSCLHKNIARWHLFQLHGQLFVSPIDRPAQGLAQEHACQESTRLENPPQWWRSQTDGVLPLGVCDYIVCSWSLRTTPHWSPNPGRWRVCLHTGG